MAEMQYHSPVDELLIGNWCRPRADVNEKCYTNTVGLVIYVAVRLVKAEMSQK